ncbi:MAG: hypothetical protein KAR44_14310 [Candidatus Aegiribacteria sp.]|nr:hypothetical protein [Candidatus Aegiribacteria sp.]
MKKTEIVIIILMALKIIMDLFIVVLTTYRLSTIMSMISAIERSIHVPAIAEYGAEAV